MNIPFHLKKYVVEQEHDNYTYIDHAVWRYIMKISISFFNHYAHSSYIDGIDKTGITIDSIPRVDNIDSNLEKFGWHAVCVRGFIPPKAFMEFQSLKILPIAADMRRIDNLTYTPAPDIVHESAGHAPIIIDEDYSEYLEAYGEVATNSIISVNDIEAYNLVRRISDLKEDESASIAEIEDIENKLGVLLNSTDNISEATELTRMNWWTVEYGLVGDIKSPLIYGAGLLSSVGESQNCLSSRVKKIPFSLDCINYPYDITEQQPQLFVCKNFKELTSALNEYSNTMAYKVGGSIGLMKAVEAKTINTCKNDIGLQITGKFSDVISNDGTPIYLQLSGPVQLSYNNIEINGHGGDYHSDGYGTVIGDLEGTDKPISMMDRSELLAIGLYEDSLVNLNFKSGIKLIGRVDSITYLEGYNAIISFEDCSVSYNDKKLFDPSWGRYDLVCSNSIISVYGGVADISNYYKFIDYYEAPTNKKSKGTQQGQNKDLELLLKSVRWLRENNSATDKELEYIYLNSINKKCNSWLLDFEIIELIKDMDSDFANKMVNRIRSLSNDDTDISKSIRRGLRVYIGK